MFDVYNEAVSICSSCHLAEAKRQPATHSGGAMAYEEGEGPPMWFRFWWGGSSFFLGHFNGILKASSEFSAQAQSIGTLFEQIGIRGLCGHVQKSGATRSCAGREVSQANNAAAINPKLTGLCQHEIASGILKKWKQCGAVQASCGCLLGHVCMGVGILILPHNSATLQFQVLMSMQVDAHFKKEQIGTLFVWLGAPEIGRAHV